MTEQRRQEHIKQIGRDYRQLIKENSAMAKCDSIIRELRFVIKDELTHVYIFCEAVGDCPLGVHGWHYKAFPASVSAIDVLTKMGKGEEKHLLWPLSGPEHWA